MGKALTKVSTKGQVIVPKSIREHRGWSAGTRLVVEETTRGVLLREEYDVPEMSAAEVYGSLKHEGPPVSLEDMDKAIETEVKHRRDRGRY